MGDRCLKYLVTFLLLAGMASSLFCCGCVKKIKTEPEPTIQTIEFMDKETVIGTLGNFVEFSSTPVVGFGIVAGLAGTGSSECPIDLRNELIKQMKQKMPNLSGMDPYQFISSKNTAVVVVEGILPTIAAKGQMFDISVRALNNTQTTSLAGGRLYTTELKERGRLASYTQFSKTLALASGPIYIDRIDAGGSFNERQGYILGGGVTVDDSKFSFVLKESSFVVAAAVRDRINERFGRNTAVATSPSTIHINIPEDYISKRDVFLRMINMMYLFGDTESEARRIRQLVARLQTENKKLDIEIALSTIGKSVLPSLQPLLSHKAEAVRFHAARCMYMNGDSRGFEVLKRFILDTKSIFRLPAIRTLGRSKPGKEAQSILRHLLSDPNFDIKYAAYEQLRKFGDISITQKSVAGEILIDSVLCKGPKYVYATRRDFPRIVLFGDPISTNENLFTKSDDNTITVNSVPEDKYVSVMRKHPTKPKLIGPLKSTKRLRDIIMTLCEDSIVDPSNPTKPGLGVSYDQMIKLIAKMCNNGSVKAGYVSGPMTHAGLKIQKKPATADNN